MIDIPRLRGSEFDATPNDTAWRAGLNLWFSAFHQVPAASLEDNETKLCKDAGLGRDIKTWRRIRPDAMRGFVKCSDGRLYHVVLAEVALEAWLGKLTQRLASGAGNAKRWKTVFDPAPVIAAIREAATMLRALSPDSVALKKVAQHLSGHDPVGTYIMSGRDGPGVPSGSQVEGEVEGEEEEHSDSRAREELPVPGQEPTGFIEFFSIYPKREQELPAQEAYAAKLAAGIAPVTILEGARRLAAHVAGQEIRWVPLAKNWLKNEGWRDTYAQAPKAPPPVELHPSWDEARAAQWREAFGTVVFDAWFAAAEIAPATDPPTIIFPKKFQRNWVANHFPQKLERLLGGRFELRVAA